MRGVGPKNEKQGARVGTGDSARDYVHAGAGDKLRDEVRVSSGDNARAHRFAAVILAAGRSSRMNDFKPLMPLGGKTVLEYIIDSVSDAGISDIVVVTGYNREKLAGCLEELRSRGGTDPADADMDIREVYNPGYDDGMFSSVKVGLAGAREAFGSAEGFFVLPVDCPLTGSDVIAEMEAAAGETGMFNGTCIDACTDAFMVPTYEGKKGHPLLVPASRVREVLDHDGTDGLKGVTDKSSGDLIRVPVSDEGCVMDMDTPEGYAEIVRFLKDGKKRTPLESLAAGRIVILVRHGKTRQHAEKMFIGRYDVPLSEEGRVMMRETAAEISELVAACRSERRAEAMPEAIYTSSLSRARESAEILKEVLDEWTGRAETAENAELAEAMGAARLAKPAKPVKLAKTEKTAETVKAEKSVGIRIVETDGLEEISLGKWDGRPVREIREMYPDEYERRGRDMFTFKAGGKAENFYDVQYRAVGALRKILETDASKVIIIVSHSGVIRALENNLKGKRVDDDWRELPKGGFTVVEV